MRHFLSYLKNFFLAVYRELVPKPVPNFKVALILPVKGAGFLHLSKNSFPLNHTNRTVFDLLFKFLRENKKRPWPQTKSRRSLVRLAWQSRSPGFSSCDYFPRHYSHSQQKLVREYKASPLVCAFYTISCSKSNFKMYSFASLLIL